MKGAVASYLLSSQFSCLNISFSSLNRRVSSCFWTCRDLFLSQRCSSMALNLASRAQQSADREMKSYSQSLAWRPLLLRISCAIISLVQFYSLLRLLLLSLDAQASYFQSLVGVTEAFSVLLRRSCSLKAAVQQTLGEGDILETPWLQGLLRSQGKQRYLLLQVSSNVCSSSCSLATCCALVTAKKKLTPQAKPLNLMLARSVISTGSLALSQLPLPSSPQVLLPQAQTLWNLLETATPKKPLMKSWSRGFSSTIFLGLSSSPKLPEPQICRAPSAPTAPEWQPAAMQVMPSSSLTRVGWHSLTLWPIPSWPYLLLPMPQTCPVAVSSSVQKTPHSTCRTLCAKLISTGVAIFQGRFTPSSPYSLDPHMQRLPSLSANPLCMAPQEKPATFPFTTTFPGLLRDLNSPVPRAPQSPNPQEQSSSLLSCTQT